MLAYSHGQLAQFRANAGLQEAIDPQNGTVILTPQEIHELNPHLYLEGVVGASFNPDDGHVNPWHTTYAFARAAARLGVEINPFTEAMGIIVEADAVKAVDTTRGRIWTPIVVDAAGPWGARIADMAGVSIPLESQRHQILVTEPVEEIVPMMVISFTHGTYFKQTPHGSVLMGYGDPEHELLGLDQQSTWDFVDQVARKILYHMPILKDVRVVRQWAGLYDMTPDSQPILGAVPDVKGLYIDVGWSGHGLQLAPSVGRIMAELIAGEEPFIDVRCLRLGRFAACELIPEPACV
jgi:sarcosine oxidase, subunit beta